MSRFTNSDRDRVSQFAYGARASGRASFHRLKSGAPVSEPEGARAGRAIYRWVFMRRSRRSGLNIIFGLNIIWRVCDGRAGMSLPQLPLIENKHRCGHQRIGRRMSRDRLSESIGADRKNPVGRAG